MVQLLINIIQNVCAIFKNELSKQKSSFITPLFDQKAEKN